MTYVDAWRRQKSAGFDLAGNSTGRRTVAATLWGQRRDVYANANLSIYSAQPCNAKCPFCVEELRPASRGVALADQKSVLADDARYFSALEEVLAAVAPIQPSVAITGGEPSKDPRLPGILRAVAATNLKRRTLTTNGSGLMDVLAPLMEAGLTHLNISRAHPDEATNARLMRFKEGLGLSALAGVVAQMKTVGTRTRLSCVLLKSGVADVEQLVAYLEFARGLGVDNVIFRQLMKTDPASHAPNYVVRYSDQERVSLEALLDRLSVDSRFTFQRQIMGYYYYVEVWKYGALDVVFEEADLAQLEVTKRAQPEVIHEMVFHPNARLASTWQPWDGLLSPLPR